MMKKKVLVGISFFIIFLFLSFPAIRADDFSGGGYNENPSDSESDSDNSDPDLPGSEETSITDLIDFCSRFGICTALTMNAGIYCFFEQRGSLNTRKVVSAPIQYYGYINQDDDVLSYLSKTLDDYIDPVTYLSEAFFPEPHDEINPWDYSWENSPSTDIPWIAKEDTDDVRLYRYEGQGNDKSDNFPAGKGCRAYGKYFFAFNETTDLRYGLDSYKEQDSDFEIFGTPESWLLQWNTLNTDINVVWDEIDFDCGKIGGKWLEDDTYSEQQCCGDDYIWLMNRPLKEDEKDSSYTVNALETAIDDLSGVDSTDSSWASLASNYCLYGKHDETDLYAVDIRLYGSYYTCGETEFDAYDPAVQDAEDWSTSGDNSALCYDENGQLLSTCPYFIMLAGTEQEPTDIGKWSVEEDDGTTTNPQVCYIETDLEETDMVPAFAWADVNEVGEFPITIMGEEVTEFSDDGIKANTICEQYLGGVWTGSHCCGNKYDYEDDTTSWYDSDSDVGYIDESFSESVPIYYDETLSSIIHNYACVEGTVIDSVNAPTSSTVPRTAHQKTADGAAEVEVLNIDGTLYGCNLAADSSLSFEPDWYTKSTLLTDTNPCELKENTYLCNYNYSDWDGDGEADDEHWDWYHVKSDEEGSYVTNTLGYDGEAETSFTWSEPVWATEDQQPGACCAGRRCWDGASCVEEHTKYSYDDDSDEETEDVISICYNGDWTGTLETKYDWYHNTDAAAIDYCVNAYACVCSTEEDDNTFCTENEEYVVAGCTLTVDFYKDDHFCEAINPTDTDGDGVYAADSSRWTSRTKFLAFQMIQIAQDVGSEFTLFCDQYSDTLNNYVDVESIAEDINSFCILSQDSDVTISVTFNSDDEDQPMTIDAEQVEELLFEGSNAFVTDILGDEDVETCSSATSYTSSERFFGEFYSCDAATEHVFYNNVLNAIIYNENGLGTTLLNYPDTDAMQELLDGTSGVKTTITTYIDTTDDDELVNPAGDEIKENFAGFSTVEDYSSLYYSTENSATIIGFEDIKYDGESDNRYYMGVLYSGITLNCDQIYAPYDSALNIHCNSDTGIILERSTEGSEFWRSLTAGIRRE
jgi:hypothetical protein